MQVLQIETLKYDYSEASAFFSKCENAQLKFTAESDV